MTGSEMEGSPPPEAPCKKQGANAVLEGTSTDSGCMQTSRVRSACVALLSTWTARRDYTHIHTQTYIYIYIYIYTYVWVYIHIHMYVYIYIYIYLYVYVYVYMYIYIYMYVYMHWCNPRFAFMRLNCSTPWTRLQPIRTRDAVRRYLISVDNK
jgi:hypothetical protein